MIFGKLTKDRNIEEQKQIFRMMNGVREFTWFPTKLANGKWVWFEYCYAYYHGGKNNDGTYFLWSASPEDYVPFADRYLAPLDPADTFIKVNRYETRN